MPPPFMPRIGCSTWPCSGSMPRTCPRLELGNSDELKQGQAVVALGNPRGLTNSVVAGVVSGVREMEGRPMIQLAIPIEPGNSGGPLVDMQGRVQGVLTMKSLVTPNLGFALTTNLVKPLLGQAEPDSDVALADDRRARPARVDAAVRRPLAAAGRAGSRSTARARALAAARCACGESPLPERPYECRVTVQPERRVGGRGAGVLLRRRASPLWFLSQRRPACGSPDSMGPTSVRGPSSTTSPAAHYAAGEWNTLRVRLEEGKIPCFVNDQPVVSSAIATGRRAKWGWSNSGKRRPSSRTFTSAAKCRAPPCRRRGSPARSPSSSRGSSQPARSTRNWSTRLAADREPPATVAARSSRRSSTSRPRQLRSWPRRPTSSA